MSNSQNKNKHPQILNLERFLPYRLSILSNRISGIIGQTYKDKFALSIVDWRIMAVLGEYPGASADEVSAKIQIEKSIISRAVQKLLTRHLIVREVDQSDRRRQNLSLTITGEDVYKQIVPVSYGYEEALLDCFSDEERNTFDALIDRLYTHAEKVQIKN